MRKGKKISFSLMVLVVFLLHQDCWNWTKTEPLVLGFLPVGLAYHAAYAVLCAVLMAVLVKFAWPRELERVGTETEKTKESNASE